VLLAAIVDLVVYWAWVVRKKVKVLPVAVAVSLSTLWSYYWHYTIMTYDKGCLGWWYEAGKSIGNVVSWMSWEDLFFYPVFNALFFAVWLVLRQYGSGKMVGVKSSGVLLATGLLFTLLGTPGAVITLLLLFVPGVCLCMVFRDSIPVRQFWVAGSILVVGAGIWDLCFRDWEYIDRIMRHSNVWCSVGERSWAWIKGKSPIEITPWFSIAGWLFGVGCFETVVWVFKKRWRIGVK